MRFIEVLIRDGLEENELILYLRVGLIGVVLVDMLSGVVVVEKALRWSVLKLGQGFRGRTEADDKLESIHHLLLEKPASVSP